LKPWIVAALVLFLLGFGIRAVSAGNPDPGPDAGITATPSPDLGTSDASTPAPDSGAVVESTPSPDLGVQAVSSSAPVVGAQAVSNSAPALGGQCFGSGTIYVQGFGCMAGALQPAATAINPNVGGCPGNASATVYGCTAGYAPITGSTNSNASGGNGCPGNSHRTVFGCTPGPP
jgi:hypothetical protein